MLMATYVMYGFDSAAELSEETRDPRRTAPKAITRCMLVSAIGGGLVLLGALMASPSLTDGNLASNGMAYVLTSQAGNVLGRIMLAIVAVSIVSAALAITASAARVMFSMARDGRLPFAAALSKVPPRTATPLMASFTVCALAIGILLLSLDSASVAVVIVYLAYLLVTVPLVIQRLRRHPTYSKSLSPEYFTLGKWGLPIDIIAIAFGIFLLIDVGWPRAEIYNTGNGPAYPTWFAPQFIIAASVIGAIAYPLMKRQSACAAVVRAGGG